MVEGLRLGLRSGQGIVFLSVFSSLLGDIVSELESYCV